LTATRVPSCNRARWTCAIEAAPIGTGSNAANHVAIGEPSSLAMIAAARSPGHRRYGVEQPGQFRARQRGEQIAPYRQILADLHGRHAPRFEQPPQPARDLRLGRVALEQVQHRGPPEQPYCKRHQPCRAADRHDQMPGSDRRHPAPLADFVAVDDRRRHVLLHFGDFRRSSSPQWR
jgi:hypothetical protein